MKFSDDSLKLYVVTDRSWLKGRSLAQQVACAVQNGATCIQLREKGMDFDRFIAEAKSIKAVAKKYCVPYIINDNVDMAIAVDADGVHLGQHDTSPELARKQLGDAKIIGVSVHTVEQAVKAAEQGADYLGVGAMFSTQTKTDTQSVSIQQLAQITRAVSIPAVAIGGINEGNLFRLKNTGIAGIAVVSAILAAEDIGLATRLLKEMTEQL